MTLNSAHLIVNPVAGQTAAPFDEFSQFMQAVNADTCLHITTPEFGAPYYAQKARDNGADLVIAYGGDGTVMEVVNTLHGSDIPVGIVAGGTANVIAHELGIPLNAKQALDFIAQDNCEIQWLDAGKTENFYFLLRMGIGWEAELSQRPTTETKEQWGTLAYAQAALQALIDLDPVTYTLTLDGEEVVVDRINCSICNIGNVGLYDIGISIDIKPDDGYLDVMVLQNKNLQGALDIAQNVLSTALPMQLEERLVRHRAKKITIHPSDSQRVSHDGEAVRPDFPLEVECVPHYAKVLRPIKES